MNRIYIIVLSAMASMPMMGQEVDSLQVKQKDLGGALEQKKDSTTNKEAGH